jgi:hypothetical protein
MCVVMTKVGFEGGGCLQISVGINGDSGGEKKRWALEEEGVEKEGDAGVTGAPSELITRFASVATLNRKFTVEFAESPWHNWVFWAVGTLRGPKTVVRVQQLRRSISKSPRDIYYRMVQLRLLSVQRYFGHSSPGSH